METPLAPRRPLRLGYCTNVHPGESLAEIEAALERHAVPVRRAFRPHAELGLGLWFPAAAVGELAAAAPRAAFRRFLGQRGLHAFTLNAFPFGGFHGASVKERVFEPSWAEPARRDYTLACAEILAELLPAGATGSISTVPLGYGTLCADAPARARAVAHLAAVSAALAALQRRTGRTLVLALEPEPCAALATVAEAAEFVAAELFPAGGEAARMHLGICVDACHEAVTFQDPERAVAALRAAGVRVGKVQVSSALELCLPSRHPEACARLAGFDEGRWFHQVGIRNRAGQVHVEPDLAPFLARARAPAGVADVAVARVHFHVPVFAAPAGGLATTREHLERWVALALRSDLTDQYEVETYSFDAIPAAERAGLGAADLSASIERELRFAAGLLGLP